MVRLALLLALLMAAGPALAQEASIQDLTALGRLNNGLGNHAGAEQAYRRVLELQGRAHGEADPALGDTLMHLALEVSNQGRFLEAAELFRRAEPLVRRSVAPLDLARLVSYQAMDAANRHSYGEARDLARQATAARRNFGGAGGSARGAQAAVMDATLARGEQVQSLLIEAAMSLKLHDTGAAAMAAGDAMAILDETLGLPGGWRVQAMGIMGDVLGRQGRMRDGEALLKEAVELSQRLFNDGMPTILAWGALGRFLADQGRYPDAMDAFRHEFALLSKRSPEGLRLGFETAAPFITTALEMADQGGSDRTALLDQVFSVLQMVQAGAQSDTVSHAALKFASGDPRIAKMVSGRQEAQRRRDEIRLALAVDSARPDDQRDLERESWQADQYRLEVSRMAELDASLKAEFPDYAGLANPAPVTIARLREVLRPGEVVVAFAFGDE